MHTHAPIALVALLGAAAGSTVTSQGDDATFTLVAEWSPFSSSQVGLYLQEEGGLADVLDPGPAQRSATYTWADVAALLPPEETALGEVWAPDAAPVVELLRQLHPSATARLHHHYPPLDQDGEENAAALVGAPLGVLATMLEDGPVIDILLRSHVQFRLRDGTVYFTPAQFEGRLVVDPAERRVLALHLALPDRNTNVDINVDNPDEEFDEVDIGHVPRLGLWTASAPPARDATTLATARGRLRCDFYTFALIDWMELPDAHDICWQSGELLHVIVLFGTLDDESC